MLGEICKVINGCSFGVKIAPKVEWSSFLYYYVSNLLLFVRFSQKLGPVNFLMDVEIITLNASAIVINKFQILLV